LRSLGWEPVVLAIEPASVEGAVLEPLLEETFPADIRVIRVRGIPVSLTRPLGLGSLWWRCGRALRRAGDELLGRECFDLVFFTTTQFDTFTLGPRWLSKFGVPYLLDYQDPWVNDYYRRTRTRPPGGALKFWFSQFTARRREPAAVRAAAGIISVSSSYGPDLLTRYPDIDPRKLHHLPFGTAAADLEIARRHHFADALVPMGDNRINFVYCGRAGADMGRSASILFKSFRRFRETHPSSAARMRFYFIGTDYAPPPLGRHWVLPHARAAGVESQVIEHCYRIPYFAALGYLVRADALILLGSDDPGYSASKIFPYLFARRPLLTLAHAQSQMLGLARGQGHPCSFGFTGKPGEQTEDLVTQVYAQWFVDRGYAFTPEGNPALLAPHTAEEMSRRLAGLFNQAVIR
jgi:hypothetical protein